MHSQRTAAYVSAFIVAVGLTFGLGSPASAAVADNYVALGDSYSSGVGAGSYTAESGSCSRSINAYPALWAAAHSTTVYRSVACSGATTGSLISSQVPALSATTTLVSVTIGGNDAGFSNIMSTCAVQGTDACVAAVNAAESFAQSTLPGRLDNAYNAIRSQAPNAKVVVLSYPVFYQLGTLCVGLSATSRAKINEGINMVDDITRTAAGRHSFTFADVRSIFVGHQLCSYGTKWLHALNFAELGISYHPTAAGQSGGYLPVFSGSAV